MEADIIELLENNKDGRYNEIIELIKILIIRRYIKTLNTNNSNEINKRYLEKYKENISKIHEYGLLDKIFNNSEQDIIKSIIEKLERHNSTHKARIKNILKEEIDIENLNFAIELLYNDNLKELNNDILKRKNARKRLQKLEELKQRINSTIPEIIKILKKIEQINNNNVAMPKFPHILKKREYNKNVKNIEEQTNKELQLIREQINKLKTSYNEVIRCYLSEETEINNLLGELNNNISNKIIPGNGIRNSLKKETENVLILIDADIIKTNRIIRKINIVETEQSIKLEKNNQLEVNFINVILNEDDTSKRKIDLKKQILILKVLVDIKENKDISYLYKIIEKDIDVVLLTTLITGWSNKEELRAVISKQNEIIGSKIK